MMSALLSFSIKMQRDICNESSVHWLISPNSGSEWVRQAFVDLVGRKGLTSDDLERLRKGGDLVYGYAELNERAIADFTDDNGQECFVRRYFYRNSDDSEGYRAGVCPIEAAAPGSIEAGVWGLSPYKKSQITVRVPKSLLWRLNAHTQRQNVGQSEFVIKAIESFLNCPPERSLEERICTLEHSMEKSCKNYMTLAIDPEDGALQVQGKTIVGWLFRDQVIFDPSS